MTSSPQKKTTVVYIGVLITLALAALVCWASFRPRALESVRTITVTVTHSDGSVFTETVETTAPYLAEALDPAGLLEGWITDYGLYLQAVDGEAADPENGVYWVFDVNGARGEYAADAQPIADGDVFSFYTVVYG